MAQSDTVAYNASGLNGKNQEFFNIEGFMLSPDKLTGILSKIKKSTSQSITLHRKDGGKSRTVT
jgi:hypothetical protein